jgi:hypothetical protein
MTIIQQISYKLVGDDGVVQCDAPATQTTFTGTTDAKITMIIPKNTTNLEFVFPTSSTKLVSLFTSLPLVVRFETTGGEARNINPAYIVNSTTALTKAYFTNASLTTDATLQVLLSDITAIA